jgi:predicted kinase
VVVVDVVPVERVERALAAVVAHLSPSPKVKVKASRVVVADALAALAAKPIADVTAALVAGKQSVTYV